MSSEFLTKVNTKLKAYKLIHDPVILLNLLFSKYGDIEEDYELLYINQLVYDKSSHYNIDFKEYQFLHSEEEFLKRFYHKRESRPRIPKLSEYYKNYHIFFCRPNFTDFIISDLMENYGDDKAEVFYKNNYEKSNSNKEQSEKNNSESLSSLDNITDNKIIFTKKTKKIIDRNLDNNYGSLTLTSNSIKSYFNNINNNNDGLISSRSLNDSFEKIVHNLIFYEKKKIKNEKNKKNELNKSVKKNTQSGKKINNQNQVGGTYASKKINKNIIYNLNINNTPVNGSNEKYLQNIRNKNSLFTLLKSKNIIHYTKTENNIINSNYINGNQNKNVAISQNLNKSQNKNKNQIFGSPKNKNKKDNMFRLTSKFEEFNTNMIRPNTSFHHKRNKTAYINQQMGRINTNPSSTYNNCLNTLSNILSKNNNNSRNYVDNFRNTTNNNNNKNKQTMFSNYLTINNANNFIKKQREYNDMKNGIKNKTFEVDNIKNNLMNKIASIKESFKVYQKNKNRYHNHKNNMKNNKNNYMDINNPANLKKNNNNFVVNIGQKFSLAKNQIKKNYNNKMSINKNTKNTIKYFNPKISPLNGLNRNIIYNNNNIGLHKKSQTTILSNLLDTSPKNHICSPISLIKHQKKLYTINKSENITSKMRPKIGHSKIGSLNINFNNVIVNAPLSNLNQNYNYSNTNYINNTNENYSYKLLTPVNNRNNISNTFSNNKSNNSHLTNNNRVKEHFNGKINYITNLKNFCNFSRNKTNIYGKSFSQNEDNYSIFKNHNYSNNAKITYEKNKISNHTNHTILCTNDKNDIFKKKKNELIIPKPNNNKKIMIKNGKKSSNKSQKTKKKIEGRNKQFETGMKYFRLTENNKEVFGNESFKIKEDIRNFKNYNKIYLSPNSTGRITTIQPINVNRNTTLIPKRITKTKQKIKLK